MKLSCCILAKNEQECLPMCLNSIVDYIDEIIVINNASTDNTKDIALKYGCIVVDFPDAKLDNGRNRYLDIASGDWILVLDADEQLTKEAIEEIYTSINSASEDVMAFSLPRYEYIGAGKWASITLCRLFRKHKDIHYNERSIHATPVPSIRKLGKIGSVFAPIHHIDILLNKRTSDKRNYYIRLLKDEIKKGTDEHLHQLHYYLGVEYAALEDYEKAEEEYKKALAICENKPMLATYRCILYLAQNYLLKGDINAAKNEAKKLFEMDTVDNERALILLAEIAVRENKLDEAEKLCSMALELNNLGAYNYINIASLLEEKKPLLAIKYINKAIELNPYLLNPIIYNKGEKPNIFAQQTSFLSCTKTIFEHMENAWRNLKIKTIYEKSTDVDNI